MAVFATCPRKNYRLLSGKRKSRLLLGVTLSHPRSCGELYGFGGRQFCGLFGNSGRVCRLRFNKMASTTVRVASRVLASIFSVPMSGRVTAAFRA